MRWRGGALAAVAAGVLVFAPAALASGPTYCVGEPSCPGESLGEAGNGEQLQAALKKAGETPESTLLIGPGDYSHAGGFKYEGGAVTIRGAGETSTLLSDDGAPGAVVLTVKPAAKAIAAVSRLGAQVPRPIEGKGNEQGGLLLEAGARLEHVDVFGGGGVEDVGLYIHPGASFTVGAILMPETETEGEADGVFAFGGEISSCFVTGAYGVVAVRTGQLAVRGCVIGARKVGVDVGGNSEGEGNLLAEDALVDVKAGAIAGVRVQAGQEKVTTATLRGLTIVGGKHGLVVEANTKSGTSTAASAVLESSVIDEATQASYDVQASAEPIHVGHKATARLRALYSDLVGGEEEGSSGDGEPIVEQEADIHEPPLFVNPVPAEAGLFEGGLHPAPGSPLIDAGVPGPLAEGELATDLEGNPRIVHGRRDIGAYEYGFAPPVVSANASPTSAVTGQSVSFTGSATVSEPGDSVVSYRWTFDDGAAVPAGASASHAFTAPGPHTATLTATDAAGVSAAAVVHVNVVAPPPPHGSPLRGPPLRVALLSGLAVSPRSFRAAKHGASVVPGHSGVGVSFKLSQAGRVRFTVYQLQPGLIRGGACVTAGGHAHGRRCTRRVLLRGSFAVDGKAGTNTLRFSGRLRGKRLPAGKYLLSASLLAGRSVLATETAGFRILG